MRASYAFTIAIALFWACTSNIASAEVFSSDNFRVLDPVVDTTSGFSSSTTFSLFQSVGQLSVGTSSSSGFGIRSGFLFFPTVTVPTVTATAGDGQVSLSWTSSTGFLGWIVSSYNVGRSTVSGGPYEFTDVGNNTNTTITGLTNNATYYFIVRPEDAFNNSIATSSQVSAVPVAGPVTTTTTGGGGGPPGLIINIARPSSVVPEVIPPEVKKRACVSQADPNKDGEIDLQDLSIFLFYHLKTPDNDSRRFDINKDNKIDIVDLSILFYCWGV